MGVDMKNKPSLEDFKKDLRYQLTFENVDWEFFKHVVELAIEQDDEWLNTSEYQKG